MRDAVNMAKALGDPARLRALRALRGGELCLCQLIALLRLAPSTVSKHLDILDRAGLVQRRKDGRWCYFRRPGRDAGPAVRAALRWVDAALNADDAAARDAQRLTGLRGADPRRLAACYKGA